MKIWLVVGGLNHEGYLEPDAAFDTLQKAIDHMDKVKREKIAIDYWSIVELEVQ